MLWLLYFTSVIAWKYWATVNFCKLKVISGITQPVMVCGFCPENAIIVTRSTLGHLFFGSVSSVWSREDPWFLKSRSRSGITLLGVGHFAVFSWVSHFHCWFFYVFFFVFCLRKTDRLKRIVRNVKSYPGMVLFVSNEIYKIWFFLTSIGWSRGTCVKCDFAFINNLFCSEFIFFIVYSQPNVFLKVDRKFSNVSGCSIKYVRFKKKKIFLINS